MEHRSDLETVILLSPHVCVNCKARKRKCSKTKPTCELCKKLLLKCEYEPTPSSSTDGLSDVGVNEVFQSTDLSNWQASTNFLSAFSGQQYGPKGSNIHKSNMKEVLQILVDNGEAVPTVFREYFRTIGEWMPRLVSKSALRKRMGDEPSSELAVLLLCMFLVTRISAPNKVEKLNGLPPNMHTKPYFAAKSLLSALLSTGNSSPEVVEASALILLYETGHGMVEQASLTVAVSAKLGMKLLSHHRSNHRSKVAQVIDDNDAEGLWRSIVFLDRYINMTLPADEIHFVTGRMSDHWLKKKAIAAPSHITGAEYRLHAFQQSIDLMGHVVEYVQSFHLSSPADLSKFQTLDEPLQLLLAELLQHATQSWEESCESIALCASALFTLHRARYDTSAQFARNPADGILQRQIALTAINSVINIVVEISNDFTGRIAYMDIPALALPATYSVYQAATLHTLFAGNRFGTPKWAADLASLKTALSKFGSRWTVGKQYLENIEILVNEETRSRATIYITTPPMT